MRPFVSNALLALSIPWMVYAYVVFSRAADYLKGHPTNTLGDAYNHLHWPVAFLIMGVSLFIGSFVLRGDEEQAILWRIRDESGNKFWSPRLY